MSSAAPPPPSPRLPWWPRSNKSIDPLSAPPVPPLRTQRSFTGSSQPAAPPPAIVVPPVPSSSSTRRGLKNTLARLKPKRSNVDVSLVIQDPPPPPPASATSSASSHRARSVGRPSAKSVSSTVRSSDPPEPRTPSDHFVNRRSFPHSVLTLSDDPFGSMGLGADGIVDPNRLSAHSSIRGAKQPMPVRESYASMSSSNQSHLSSPMSPLTYNSNTDATSPSWTDHSAHFDRLTKPRVRIPSFPATRAPDAFVLAQRTPSTSGHPTIVNRRRGLTEGSISPPVMSRTTSKEPSPTDNATPVLTHKSSRPALSRQTSNAEDASSSGHGTWGRASTRGYPSAASSRAPTPPSASSSRPPRVLIRQASAARIGPPIAPPPTNIPLPPTPAGEEGEPGPDGELLGKGLGMSLSADNSSRLSFASMSSLSSHEHIMESFAEFAGSPPQRLEPLAGAGSDAAPRKDSATAPTLEAMAVEVRAIPEDPWMNDELSFAQADPDSPLSPFAPSSFHPRRPIISAIVPGIPTHAHAHASSAATSPNSPPRVVRRSISHQNFRRPNALDASARTSPATSSPGGGPPSPNKAPSSKYPKALRGGSSSSNRAFGSPQMTQSASAGHNDHSRRGNLFFPSRNGDSSSKKSADKDSIKSPGVDGDMGRPSTGHVRKRIFSNGPSLKRSSTHSTATVAVSRDLDDVRSIFSLPDSTIDIQTLSAPTRPSARSTQAASTAAAALTAQLQLITPTTATPSSSGPATLSLVDALAISPSEDVPPSPPFSITTQDERAAPPQQIKSYAELAKLEEEWLQEREERGPVQPFEWPRPKPRTPSNGDSTHTQMHTPLSAFDRARIAGTTPGPLRTGSLSTRTTPEKHAHGTSSLGRSPSTASGLPARGFGSPTRDTFPPTGLPPPPRRRRPLKTTDTANEGMPLPHRMSFLDKRASAMPPMTPLSPAPRTRRPTLSSKTPSRELLNPTPISSSPGHGTSGMVTPVTATPLSSSPFGEILNEVDELGVNSVGMAERVKAQDLSLSRKPSFLDFGEADVVEDSFLDLSRESFDEAGSDYSLEA